MYEAMMIAATGVTNHQKRLDAIADNIANANTNGFKAVRVEFKDALYTAGFGIAATPEGNQQKGHGVMVASITKINQAGSVIETGNMMDFLINGDGFFEIQDAVGNIRYTKAGNFYISTNENGTMNLVDSSGNYVLNEQGNRIVIPEGTERIEVQESGEIHFIAGESSSVDMLGIYTFQNIGGLSAVGENKFETTVASGLKIASGNSSVLQGALESSNVSLATEMTSLIRAQRAFTFSSKALKTADDMEGIANSMRR